MKPSAATGPLETLRGLPGRLGLRRPSAVAVLAGLAVAVGASPASAASIFTGPLSRSTAKVEVDGAPEVRNVTGSSAHLTGRVVPNGAATNWRFEYTAEPANPASWAAVPGAAGTVSQAQAEALPGGNSAPGVAGRLTGLSDATVYYVRLFAENECAVGCGAVTSPVASFETSGPPTATTFATHAIHDGAIRVLGSVDPHSIPTSDEQTVTIGGAPTGGTFALAFKGQSTGASGTGTTTAGSNEITALATTTGSFSYGEQVSGAGIPAGTIIETGGAERLKLSAAATATAEGVALAANLPYDASSEVVKYALNAVAAEVFVEGPAGGPYTVWFGASSVSQPQLTADASGLTPAGTVTVVTAQEGGVGYDARYHFEYVTREQFEQPGGEGGFAKAASTPEVDIGSGSARVVGEDLPGLQAGKTYEYRLTATNDAPGDPVVHGGERTLTVPGAPASGGEGCPNEALRSGPSAHLPDCRAYEQITPLEKEGAYEVFKYGPAANGGALYGEDGEHVMIAANQTHWGAGPEAGQGPYFFSRSPAGWSMTAGSPEPEAGIDHYIPTIFGSDLTQFGFAASWLTSPGSSGSSSPDVEFKAGPPGGPYATVAAVPSREAAGGWVAASADLGKLILSVEDRTLLGHSTGTTTGSDLYEWSGGQLRQLNVTGPAPGSTIGSCGARVVRGNENGKGDFDGAVSSVHAVSADGSRVFFEAVPGSICSEPSHLYMRVNGSETVDLGAYRFLAADAEGARVLVEKRSGESGEVLLYDTASATAKPLFSALGQLSDVGVSEDLTAIYFQSKAQLTPEAPAHLSGESVYRYDIAAEKIHFMVQIEGSLSNGESIGAIEVSPDGRYYYFDSEALAGLPAGHPENPSGILGGVRFRYDSVEDAIECISCASPFDPEPSYAAEAFSPHPGGALESYASSANGRPQVTFASSDGDYAVFETASALVPQDVNGEIPYGPSSPFRPGEKFSEYIDGSPSNDVYEWRRDGVGGCAHIQGCLSLITPGSQDGVQVVLLGMDASGRDIFFYTHSQLVRQDKDTEGDIYDARIGGGFPVPARPVECEGTTCSSPEGQPNDATPSSFTFSGVGNVSRPPAAKPGKGSRSGEKHKTKKKQRKPRKKRTGKRSKGRAGAGKSSGRSKR